MNRITYLEHSGFAITTPEVILVFDYYRDPSHALHKILEQNPSTPVIFFVTHRHQDHYNKSIYELAQNHKRVYVVSNDVPAREIPSTLAVQGMSAGDYVEGLPGGVSVKAYASTDEGVSYYVIIGTGETIFHAGDLNDWHWQAESTQREVEKADADFRKVVNRIASEHPSVDIAMFPVDVRQGDDFARGARTFLDTIAVKDFFPMHFDGDYKLACNSESYCPERTVCHCLHEPGQSIDLPKV
ncbi:MAG: MBL fold metallo-hydrolase [Muribaculaceae bacterium]|nr:MBL fold metallo-hydrolase [Muribaculaceae bacterium]